MHGAFQVFLHHIKLCLLPPSTLHWIHLLIWRLKNNSKYPFTTNSWILSNGIYVMQACIVVINLFYFRTLQ